MWTIPDRCAPCPERGEAPTDAPGEGFRPDHLKTCLEVRDEASHTFTDLRVLRCSVREPVLFVGVPACSRFVGVDVEA